LRKVAQALAEIQKNGHSERRLTLGFLGAWPVGLKVQEKSPDYPDVTQLELGLDGGET